MSRGVDPAVLAEIHRYWFGDLSGPLDFPRDKAPIWFKRSDETDDFIRREFGRYIRPAAESVWDPSAMARQERVGLVVLLDQFPRNIFRESGEAFAYDPAARRLTTAFIAAGLEEFFLVERSFLFLPFEHSEDIADQRRSVELYSALAEAAPADQKESYAETLRYAVIHRDLIARFGRFPHRNAVLGRVSTPEEEAFLKEHGRGY